MRTVVVCGRKAVRTQIFTTFTVLELVNVARNDKLLLINCPGDTVALATLAE